MHGHGHFVCWLLYLWGREQLRLGNNALGYQALHLIFQVDLFAAIVLAMICLDLIPLSPLERYRRLPGRLVPFCRKIIYDGIAIDQQPGPVIPAGLVERVLTAYR